jgi:hypothetical protein
LHHSEGEPNIHISFRYGAVMKLAIIESPIRFRLYGLSSVVSGRAFGQVGLRLMDEMWRIVKGAGVPTTGINHWVYLPDDQMFVGVEVRNPEAVTIPEPLESCEFKLPRYARHLHIGLYRELGTKWQALKSELAALDETVTLPSLEVYGHSCEGPDEAKAETTIVLGLV